MNPQEWQFTLTDVGFRPKNLLTDDEVTCRMLGLPLPAVAPYPVLNPNIGGLEHYYKEIMDLYRLPQFCPVFYINNSIQAPKGVILHGCPGNGKSKIMAAISDNCNVPPKISYFKIRGHELFHGNADINLKKLFDAASKLSPSVIFVDEGDSLVRRRSAESTAVETLLNLIDDVSIARNVVTVIATNNFGSVDPALLRRGRLHVHIQLRNPVIQDRRNIIGRFTAAWTGMTPALIDVIATNTRGYSRAEVIGVCEDTALHALRRLNPSLLNINHQLWIQPNANINITVTLADIRAALGY